MKLAILGFGREGKSVLNFLKRANTFRDNEPWILDKNPSIKIPKGIHSITGKDYLKNLAAFDVVFRSPGTPYNLPEIQRARKAGAIISSATKLFFEVTSHLSSANGRLSIIGITGTKGKGTTATILYNILKQAGKDVFLAGNIGAPALELLPKIESRLISHKSKIFVVLELSSFQLQDLEVSPRIAAVTDIFPDHQDSHKGLAEYYGAKTNIARRQKKTDVIFFMAHNAMSRRIASKSKGKKIAVDEKTFSLFSAEILKIKGVHNFKNAAMAATVAKHLGIPARTIIETIKKFPGNEHRLEFVRKIRGVEFYNDSASTNPHTTAAAIAAFQNPTSAIKSHKSRVIGPNVILIAGGQDKNLDYAPLSLAIRKNPPKLIVLMGENKKKILTAIKKRPTNNARQTTVVTSAQNLKEAIVKSYLVASSLAAGHKSSVVLFSPGATSFDLFENYAERGKEFKQIVRGLTEEQK